MPSEAASAPVGADVLPFEPPARSVPGRSDSELVMMVRSGSQAAQGELYSRHVERLLVRATRLLARVAEAEDVTHDAFLIAFRDVAALRDPAQFGSWLQSIALRLVHRRFRRRRLLQRFGLARGQDDAALAVLAKTGDPEVALELSRVDEILRALPAEQRIAWVLRAVEGCALSEIAEHCDCSLATTKRRIRAAQAKIAECTEVRLPEEPT